MAGIKSQELDLYVFEHLNSAPFGVNLKEYFIEQFRANPEAFDDFFEGGSYSTLDEQAIAERETALSSALAKFDVVRKVFDK